MRPPHFSAAKSRLRAFAFLALSGSAVMQAIPPDQRTIYDEWIRDSQARTAAEARDKKLWATPPKQEFTGGGPQARLEREAREAWAAGERRMRERREALEAVQRAREAELRELTRLYDSAAAGDPDALMTLGKQHESSSYTQWGLRDYQRVYGPRRAEALRRMVTLIKAHPEDGSGVLSLQSCLRQLALLGDVPAAGELARLYLADKDFYQAGIYFAQAGAAGDAAAQKEALRLVGEDRVDGVTTEPAVFYGWARTWATKGDLASQWVYGNALAVGGEIPKNEEQALVVLKQASDQATRVSTDEQTAMARKAAALAGLILLEGRGVKADAEKGVALLQEAVGGGSTDAIFTLGRAYFQGAGVRQDTAEAIKWLTQAANAGEARSAELLGTIYLQENSLDFDEAKGVEWLAKASKRRPQAMLDYGKILAVGDHGVARDQEEALALFTRAIQHYPNNPEVLEFIGQSYLLGNYGLKEKPAEGVRYLKRAVERGSRSAAFQLAAIYREGAGEVAPDAAESAQWKARGEAKL